MHGSERRPFHLEEQSGKQDIPEPETGEPTSSGGVEKRGSNNEGEGWLTANALATTLDYSYVPIVKIADSFRQDHPEWFRRGLYNKKETTYYSPELVEILKTRTENFRAPQGWNTPKSVAKESGVDWGTVVKIADSFRQDHPEWFRSANDSKRTTYYSPELLDAIKEKVKEAKAPEGWSTPNKLSKDLDFDWGSIIKIADSFRADHPEWIKDTSYRGGTTYYSPELVSVLRERIKEILPPEGWVTQKTLSRELGPAHQTIAKIADSFRADHPEWIKDTSYRGGTTYYSPELVSVLRERIKEILPPEGWVRQNVLAKELGCSNTTIAKIADSFRQDHPEWIKSANYRGVGVYYSPEAIEIIKKDINVDQRVPENWLAGSELAKVLRANPVTIKKRADSFRADHPEWFESYRNGRGQFLEYYSPELIEAIKGHVNADGWTTPGTLANELNCTSATITKIANNFLPDHPEWFRSFSGKIVKAYYSPELVALIKEQVGKFETISAGWKTSKGVSDELNCAISFVANIADSFRQDHPEWFKTFLVRGRSRECYSPELVTEIKSRKNDISKFESWQTCKVIAGKLGRDYYYIKNIADSFRQDHPEWFVEASGKKANELFSPELVSVITEKLGEFEEMPENWKTSSELGGELSRSHSIIDKIAEIYRLDHPEWFKTYLVKGRQCECFAPELASLITEQINDLEVVPSGWLTASDLSRKSGRTYQMIRENADAFRESNPEWFKKYKTSGREPYEYYAPELVEEITKNLNNYEKAPGGWQTNFSLANNLGRSEATIKKITDAFRESNPDWFVKYLIPQGQVREHYAPELVQFVIEELGQYERQPDVEEGWLTNRGLSQMLHRGQKSVAEMAENFRNEHPEWFKTFLSGEGKAWEYYSPQMVTEIQQKFISSEESLLSLVQEINSPEELSSKEFSSLVNLFGPGAAVDIIYKYHPNFSGVPVGYVRSVIGEYLGNFLVERHGFSLEDLENVGPLAEGDSSLLNSLFEIMKQDCLSFCQQNGGTDYEAIKQRLEQYRQKVGDTNPAVSTVIDRVDEYYKNVFDFKLPENMVDSLRPGREFPDLNQKINVQEIEDKKRLLIADYMGLGKSASAIVAKEHLQCKTCVVVAPSNVIPIWEGYLGPENFVTDADGNQKNEGGYFKSGQEPRVLVINNIEDLDQLGAGAFDYVLISQEKLNDRYTEALTGIDYDMLIVDEVHKLKNIKTGIRSNNLIELADKLEGEDQYLVMLSGTPIPNKIEDVAIELKLLYPEKFGQQDDRSLVQQIVQGDALNLRELLLPRMQRKELGTSLEMPKLLELTQDVALAGMERQIYELLLEEDELEASKKIQLLRQFLLNPEIVDPTPNFTGAKIEAADAYLQEEFSRKDRVIMFVNGYVEGVIRGEKTILQKLHLPQDVSVRVIEGNIDPSDRYAIQRDLKEHKGKMLLVVSGQTADVGVDFSGGQTVYFYNEPWNKAIKDQETSRVYREGVEDDVVSTTSVTQGTIEEGMQRYIGIKHQAIEKILSGIPTTDLEKELLKKDERVFDENLEVNPDLARYYLSSVDRMLKIYSYVKEMGEKDFQKFLQTFGREYASCYLDVGSRSYQGNNSRVTATLLDKMFTERKQDKKSVKVLDLASGPEMLRRHSREDIAPNIFSLDINRHHFDGSESGSAVVGSFVKVPFADNSFDYINLGFALHYTKFLPSRGEYERLGVLQEMNRVLKDGGRAVITMVHNLDFKDENEFRNIASALGFRIIDEYSGRVESGHQYRSTMITLEKAIQQEKTEGIIDSELRTRVLAEKLGKDHLQGLKFRENKKSALKDSRHIIDVFELSGQTYPVNFNSKDADALEEQSRYLQQGRGLIDKYGSINVIPADQVVGNGFARILVGKKHILFKRMLQAGGAVVIRDNK